MRKWRLMLLAAVAAVWLGAIALRLYDLQIRHHEHYRKRAEKQQQKVVVLSPPRGTIYDARGRELAVSIEVDSAAADPSAIEDPAAAAAALAPLLGADVEKLAGALASEREFVWLARKLDPPRAEAIRELEIEGVFFLQESKRYYPMRRLAAQVLGYVGTDNKGLAGLEFLYDAVVAGEPGKRTVVRDARFGTALHPHLDEAKPTPGQDLHLTLDAVIQHLAERELAAAVEASGAKKGMTVVMDPSTGAILAMASYPAFDPNDFASSPRSRWRNSVVEDAFEPGSTFKLMTVAAALEAGAVDPLETIDCEMGGITLNGIRIADHRPFGDLTAREIIAKSSNVGAIKLGFAAGRERQYDVIRKFGFGRPTGVDLPSESSGILRPLDRWSALTPAYVSFGQGISTTALQMTNAFAAIANGGRLLKPYMVQSIGGGGPRQPQVTERPISPSSVLQARSMLESVVLEGTAKTAAIEGYRAAGKTGTAQKAMPGRGYVAGKYVASFIGFAPVKNPVLACAVILDEPWPRYHGGDVAAPVFRKIASQILLDRGVLPDRDGAPGTPAPAVRWAENREPRPTLPLAQPASSLAQPASPAREARQAVPAGTVPDFAGLSARQAVSLSAGVGLRLALKGHGAVDRQSPPPGTPLEDAGTVEIWLANAALVPLRGNAALVPLRGNAALVPLRGSPGAM